jgi:hypothetical protein
MLLGLLICAAYFFLNGNKAGKKIHKPVAIPVFRPPNDLSPASVNYLNNRMYDNKALGATLLEMAVKGAIQIRYEGKRNMMRAYTLVNTSKTELLRPEEQKLHTTIFAGKDRVSLDSSYNENIHNAKINFEKSLKEQWKTDPFTGSKGNESSFGAMILFFIIYMVIMGLKTTWMAFLMATPFISIAFLFITPKPVRTGIGYYFLMFFMFIFVEVGLLFVVLMVFGLTFVVTDVDLDHLSYVIHLPSAVFFAVSALMYCVYAQRVKRFTVDGAKLYAELEGFRMYLKTAEEHRLNMLTPPERTPELFERLLPYAVALGVSKD